MKVNEIPTDKICKCCFHDSHGNWIPFEMVIDQLIWWEIYSASNLANIKIIAPKSACVEFMRDAIGSLKGKSLATLQEIAQSLSIDETICKAWLWSCAEYGLTQREFPLGETKIFWVME